MKNLILSELRNFSKNYKFKLLVLALIIVGIIGSFGITAFNIGNLEKNKKEDIQYVRGALKNISEKERMENPQSEPTKSLIALESLISNQQMAIIMDNNQLYLEKESEIIDLQLKLIDEKEVLNIQTFLPPLFELKGDKVVNEYLVNQKLMKAFNLLTGVNYTSLFIGLLLSCFSLFLFILSSDILIDDFNHATLIKGLPYTFSQRLWAKIWPQFLLIMTAVFLAISAAFLTMSLKYSVGQLNYPRSIYTNNRFYILPFTTYVPLALAIIACLTLFILLFSLCLNLLTKNTYVTLFIEVFLYFIPSLLPISSKYLAWLPFTYFNFNAILSGKIALISGNAHLDWLTGLLVLVTWTVILSLGIHYGTTSRKVAKA